MGTPVRIDGDTSRYHYHISTALLADGGWVTTYTSNGQDGAGGGIYQQHFDATGAMVGSETLVNTTTAYDQYASSIAALPDGGWVVLWQEGDASFADVSLHWQMYDSAGNRLGSENEIATGSTLNLDGDVTGLADGSFLVSWTDFNAQSDYSQVKMLRFAADGTQLSWYGNANLASAIDQQTGTMTALADGGWLANWLESDGTVGSYKLGIRRYDQYGSPSAVQYQDLQLTSHPEEYAAAGLTDKGWVLAWVGADASGSGIMQQRYNSLGRPVGDATTVNITTASAQYDVSMASLSNGGWVVAWVSETTGGIAQIHQQVYSAAGKRVGVEQTVSDWSQQTALPHVTALESGDWVIDWEASGAVYQAHFDYATLNAAPVLGADRAETGESQSVRVDVLANDSDDEGDSLSLAGYTLLSNNADIAIDRQGRMVVHYTGPDLEPGETAVIRIRHEVSDGAESAASVLRVLVHGERQAGDDITGSTAADRLIGTAVAERLDGAAGDDLIRGRGGNDEITGGRGDDRLAGGSGQDLFVFAAGDGHDVIAEFDALGGTGFQDHILANFDDVASIDDSGLDTLVTFVTGDTILLIGVAPRTITAEDFVLIT